MAIVVKRWAAPDRWASFPMWKQGELSPDCGPYCAFALAKHFGTKDAWNDDYSVSDLLKQCDVRDIHRGCSKKLVRQMLEVLGLDSRLQRTRSVESLTSGESLGLVLIRWDLAAPTLGQKPSDPPYDPQKGHYVVLLEAVGEEVVLADPYPGVPRVYSVSRLDFDSAWRKAGQWGVGTSARP